VFFGPDPFFSVRPAVHTHRHPFLHLSTKFQLSRLIRQIVSKFLDWAGITARPNVRETSVCSVIGPRNLDFSCLSHRSCMVARQLPRALSWCPSIGARPIWFILLWPTLFKIKISIPLKNPSTDSCLVNARSLPGYDDRIPLKFGVRRPSDSTK
jgi:hypothetical protein